MSDYTVFDPHLVCDWENRKLKYYSIEVITFDGELKIIEARSADEAQELKIHEFITRLIAPIL